MTGMRELNDAELENVSGAGWKEAWHYCSVGSTGGGTSGLYPNNVECAPRGPIGQAIYDAAQNALHGKPA